jgi:transcriptional regulator with XRE-family HTH domain
MQRPREALISERVSRELGLNEAARACGMRSDTLARAEDGLLVQMGTARKLAAFYDRPLVELFPDWAEAHGRFNGRTTTP